MGKSTKKELERRRKDVEKKKERERKRREEKVEAEEAWLKAVSKLKEAKRITRELKKKLKKD